MGAIDMQDERADKDSCSPQRSSLEHGHHDEHDHHHDEPMTPEEVVRSLLVLGQVALNAGDYESAVEAYASVLQLQPEETALYNLASLRARGLGGRKDLLEAAQHFHQAELLGNVQAGKLCGKCMYDFINEGLGEKTPADVYAAMAVFVSRVYPEASDQKLETNHGLLVVANTHLSKGERDEAKKVFQAAAEFGNDEQARAFLATL